jgi:hypothetical protein
MGPLGGTLLQGLRGLLRGLGKDARQLDSHSGSGIMRSSIKRV